MAKSFLRIRPIDCFSSSNPDSDYFKLDDTKIECRPPPTSQCFKNSKSSLKDAKRKIYEFDKVLDENAKQEELYNDCVQPLLTEFFNGENVLLFAYGTTSSGKTFTMRGDGRNPGVVPRCISDIFQSVQSKLVVVPNFKRSKFNEYNHLSRFDLKKETEIKSTILNSVDDRSLNLSGLKSRPDGFKSFLQDDDNIFHIVWVSFLELYNENLIDLLAINPTSPNSFNSFQSTSTERAVPLKIMRDQQQNFFVSNLTHVYVNSAGEAMKVYLFGIDNLKKHISSTAMNRTSSRSHSLFTISVITLKKKNNDYHVLHVNNFSLCDLAGQERSKKTQTTGIHMKEAGAINKSLFSLKRCIQVLKERKNSSSQSVIPFTESVLTKAFQPYLSGNGLTFMIININPKADHFDETINTFDFSATAIQVVSTCRNESSNLLKEKLQRFTQLWLQTSKRWSIAQNMTLAQPISFIADKLTSNHRETKSSADDRDDLIVDSQNILKKFDSTFFENSITQKVREMEGTIVEYDLYDSQFVEDLNNRIDELEQQIENADQASEDKEINLEGVYNSIAEIYQRHEAEKNKIKERMNKLMNDRMGLMKENHNLEVEDYESEIDRLNLLLLSKDEKIELLNQQLEQAKNDSAQNNEKIELLNQQLEQAKNDSAQNNEHIAKLTEQSEYYKNETIQNIEKNTELIKQLKDLKNQLIEIESKNCLDDMKQKVDYENQLESLTRRLEEEIKNRQNKSRLLSLNNSLNDEQLNVNNNQDDNYDGSKRVNSTIKPSTTTNDNEYQPQHDLTNQLSLIDFNNKSIIDAKRSSLKRDFNEPHQPSFISDFQPNRLSSNLNSTTHQEMRNADQLLESMCIKNHEKEIRKLKEEAENQNKQFKVLLDMKDEQIKNLKLDYQRIQKEINKPIKEEGISIISSSQAKITRSLYTSVLNHTSIVGNNTPFKPLSQLAQSARKKRPIDEDHQSSDARYLDFIKKSEKSPTTEKKTKRKRTATEPKQQKIKEEEMRIEEAVEEEKDDEVMDDLIFLVEETAKKSKKPRPKKEVTTSVRKKMPLNECRESFHFDNDDLNISQEDAKKKRNLRSRRKIVYK